MRNKIAFVMSYTPPVFRKNGKNVITHNFFQLAGRKIGKCGGNGTHIRSGSGVSCHRLIVGDNSFPKLRFHSVTPDKIISSASRVSEASISSTSTRLSRVGVGTGFSASSSCWAISSGVHSTGLPSTSL